LPSALYTRRGNILKVGSYLKENTSHVRLLMFKESITVYCENQTELISKLCGPNVMLFDVKARSKLSRLR